MKIPSFVLKLASRRELKRIEKLLQKSGNIDRAFGDAGYTRWGANFYTDGDYIAYIKHADRDGTRVQIMAIFDMTPDEVEAMLKQAKETK